GFLLVHVSTSLEVCEARDRKGLYAKARAGVLPEFTGISDPYEVPDDADVTIDTTQLTPEEAAQQIILHLESEGYVGAEGSSASEAADHPDPAEQVGTRLQHNHAPDSGWLPGGTRAAIPVRTSAALAGSSPRQPLRASDPRRAAAHPMAER